MKLFKNIKLKTGDIIRLKDSKMIVNSDLDNQNLYILNDSDVKEIKRPIKYTTIYRGQLLDKYDISYLINLENLLNIHILTVTKYELRYFTDKKIEYEYIIIKYINNINYKEYLIQLPMFNKNERFKNLEINKKYTREDLI